MISTWVANVRILLDFDNEGKVTETDEVIIEVTVIEAVAANNGVLFIEADAIDYEAAITDNFDALVVVVIKADLVAVTGSVCTKLDDSFLNNL